MTQEKEHAIVLFDGVCHLCLGFVGFILRWEKSNAMRFASLQSEAGKTLLQKHGFPMDYLQGVVLIDRGKSYDRSSACLRIAGKLKFPLNLLICLLLLPKSLRDLIYDGLAKVRYRWFGKGEHCVFPRDQDASRFLRDLDG